MSIKSLSPATPAFQSSTLRNAVAASRDALEGFNAARDAVSNDIKTLEAYLLSTGVTQTFRFALGKSIATDGNDAAFASALEYGGGASGTIEENAIVWGETTGGKWRLLFETNSWDGSVEVDAPGGPYFWDEATLSREVKPLIETKLEIRIAYYEHLPQFIRAFADTLRIGPLRVGIDDEVPF
jgi:hypothetical protein